MRWASLIEDRHNYWNLILLCADHSRVIDDPVQGITVADLTAMKEAHVESIKRAVSQRHASAAGRSELGIDQLLGQTNLDLPEDPTQWSRRARLELEGVDPEAAASMRTWIGDPADRAKVAALIDEWPEQIRTGSNLLQNLLIREAEGLGLWQEAGRAWVQSADGLTDELKADRLVRAAIDYSIAGEADERTWLLREAEALDPTCPRLILERLDDEAPADEQIAYLLDIRRPEDDRLYSLIQASLSRAYLIASDFDRASEALDLAEELQEDTVAARICRVNLEVQKARIALLQDREFDMNRLLDARDRALELRNELVEAGRWSESLRLLMLAGDVPMLLKEPEAAQAILDTAREEELGQPDGPEVLGEAALRVGAPELALRFLRGSTDSPSTERIRAAAELDLDPRNTNAIETLERLAAGQGPEAEHAAGFRLMACLPPSLAEWHEPSADLLEGTDQEGLIRKIRVLSTVPRDPDAAKRLAMDLPAETWAAEVRVRVALAVQDEEMMALSANEFLAFAPDQSGRVLASEALLSCGDVQNARIHAAQVANSMHCPPKVRSDAFDLLLRALAKLDDWGTALSTWEAWRDLSIGQRDFDSRISAWQVRVYHHN